MLGQVRKVSGQRLPASPLPSTSAVGDEEEDEGVGRQQMNMHRSRFGHPGPTGGNVPTGPAGGQGGAGNGAIGDMGKAGNTRRVFVKRSSFGPAGNQGYQGYQGS